MLVWCRVLLENWRVDWEEIVWVFLLVGGGFINVGVS